MENCQNPPSIDSTTSSNHQNSHSRRNRHNGTWGQQGTFRSIPSEGFTFYPDRAASSSFSAAQLSDSLYYPHLFAAPSQDVRQDPSSSRPRGKTFHRRKFHNKVQDSAAATDMVGACGGGTGESISSETSSATNHHHYKQHHRQHRKDRKLREENNGPSEQQQAPSLGTEERKQRFQKQSEGSEQPAPSQGTEERKPRFQKPNHTSEQPPATEDRKPRFRSHHNRNERHHHQQQDPGGTDSIPRKERTYKRHSRHHRNLAEAEKSQAEPSAPFMEEDPKQELPRENGYYKDDGAASNSLQWMQQQAPSAPAFPYPAATSDRYSSKPLKQHFKRNHLKNRGQPSSAGEDPEIPQEYNNNNNRRAPPAQRLFDKLRGRHHNHRYQKHGEQHSKTLLVPDVNYNEDDATQRERLTEQLKRGEYECMVCCEPVLAKDPVWNCTKCFNLFHFHCTRKWARTSVSAPSSSSGQSIWRCPACQHQFDKVPDTYLCFCGKVRSPEFSPHLVPHSCGGCCSRYRSEDCPHPCTLQCHPGPCPECSVQLSRRCPCGKNTLMIRCSTSETASCGDACGKLLNCHLHYCELTCHTGDCPGCTQILTQKCYCGRDQRKVSCTVETARQESYSCGQPCDQSLGCDGDHHCPQLCHPSPCLPCDHLPSLVSTCPCGKVPLDLIKGSPPRTACTDPIPTCSNICGKPLACSLSEEAAHTCQSRCHEGPCPPCSLQSSIKCRCGATTTTVPCQELATTETPVCTRRCKARKSCGWHRCQQLCCVDQDHLCDLMCNKKLSCGLHTCDMPCHLGKCPPCPNVSFEDLPCHCGKTLRMAPIPCGASPPECKELCRRDHPCGHPISHQCHSEPECPPCPALTEKWCFGKHEIRGNVPCFIDGISCGKPCGKPLPCGKHTCQQLCHAGPCDPTCTQPCPEERPDCKHPCAAPCHQGPCPKETYCKVKVMLSCTCGHRSETVPCGVAGNTKPTLSLLSSRMHNFHLGQSVDITELLSALKNNAKLECNDECAILERNRRLAEALQIDPMEHKPPQPNYSEFLKDEARKHPELVKEIYETIHNLVSQSKVSKLKTQSYSFPSMKKTNRHIVHEIAEAFGCQTQAFDLEPNRNVVVTAVKHQSTIPAVSIMTLVQQEAGLRKIPNPVNSIDPPKDKPPPIDYFDYDI